MTAYVIDNHPIMAEQIAMVGIPADRERSFRRIVNTHSDLS